jgi:CDP-diacylglycerol--glycerol-3-phosphate 3-phosphatidyltransferase
VEDTIKEHHQTFSDILREKFKRVANIGASFLLKIGFSPNSVTYLGFLGHLLAAYFVARGMVPLGGVILLIMAPLDVLDGTMARLIGGSTTLGSFVDSVTDRYSEFIIFGGLLFYYLQKQNDLAVILVYLSIAGSILVSYIRAKAESLKLDAKLGILSRVERYIILIPGLIFNIPIVSLWIIAVLANITAIQRIFHVHKQVNHPPKIENL